MLLFFSKVKMSKYKLPTFKNGHNLCSIFQFLMNVKSHVGTGR
jgi:hypothetical protein